MRGFFPRNRLSRKTNDSHDSIPLSASLEKILDHIDLLFDCCDDLVKKQFELANAKCCLLFVTELVNQSVMEKIHHALNSFSEHKSEHKELFTFLEKHFSITEIFKVQTIDDISKEIVDGNTVLIKDKLESAIVFRTSHFSGRKIGITTTEQGVMGPKEGFTEKIEQNIMLIRKRIKTPALKVENLTLGVQTKTKISIVYIKGIADEKIVHEVHHRLTKINIDGILDSHYIQSMIKDSPRSPVPTVYSTEKPERVCGNILDGKVAIVIDGTPFVLTVPALFVEFLHAGDDYFTGGLATTIIRAVRFLGLFVTLILPAFFVALTTFHQDLLQSPFIIRIAANRETLPYPVVVEALFMLLTYELLREAGLRMPKPFGGPLLTILGLIIISQTAIQAGIVGPILTVVISVTALTSFILPNYEFHQVVRFASIPFLFLAGVFGFMGILVGLMFGLTYLASLRSFGVPYLSPLSPARKESWKDVFFRAPWWAMETRHAGLGIDNLTRSGAENYSKPPRNKEDE